MALTTNIKVVQTSGLGTSIIDENIGTGDGSANNYNLDNTNVISGSYSLFYAASTNNSLTELTETTDYSLDVKSGRIILTGTGLSLTNSKIIYGQYTYIDDEPDDDTVTSVRENAEEEVKRLTGQYWETDTLTEYYNGVPLSNYPTTDFPFDYDYARRDFIELDHYPVQYINNVWFLSRGNAFAESYNYDANLTTYTDITSDINSPEQDDVTLFAAVPAVSDIVYYGNAQKFLSLQTVLKTVGTGSPAITWEYYNGSTWATVTVTASVTGANLYTATGKVSWDEPANWSKVAVNGGNELYYIRSRLTTGYTIAPIAQQIGMNQNSVIQNTLAISDYDIDAFGKLTFLNRRVPEGVRNIKVEYVVGETDSDRLLLAEELAELLGGLRLLVGLSAGSYNDATSYTVGSKAVTVGEQYVNIREVISQFKNRINEVLDQIGRRVEFDSW